jgi:cell division protein FtsB
LKTALKTLYNGNMDLSFLFMFAALLIVFFIGYILGKKGLTKKLKSSVLSGSGDENLENELLKDQLKQLEAKIKTLERALDMTK